MAVNINTDDSTYDLGSVTSATVTIHSRIPGSSGNSGKYTPSGVPVISIAATIPWGSEEYMTPGEFTVTRAGDLSGALQVEFTVDGSGMEGVDYTFSSQDGYYHSITIPAGHVSATVQVKPTGSATAGGLVKTVVATLAPSDLGPSDAYEVGGDDNAAVSIATEEAPEWDFGSSASNQLWPAYEKWTTNVATIPNTYIAGIFYYYYPTGFLGGDGPGLGGVLSSTPVSISSISQGQHGQVNEVVHSFQDVRGSFEIHYVEYIPQRGDFQATDNYSWTISANQKNYVVQRSAYFFDLRPPSLVNPGDQSSSTGDAVDEPLTATDPENNPLTFTATGLPPGLSVDPVNGDVLGHVDYGDEVDSPYYATITTSNGILSASQSFIWNVTPAAPSIDNADDTQWDDMNNGEGDTVSFPIQASDPDGLPLAYSATGLPAGVTIDPVTGIIAGTIVQGDDTGTPYDVVVSVSNGSKATTLEFDWTITQDSFAAPSDQTNVVGDQFSLAIIDDNKNGKTLTYSAIGLPDGLSIDPNTGIISGNPDSSDGDGVPWQVTIDVTDGTETAEHTFNWTIDPTIIPIITLSNPGNQRNFTDETINLPIQGAASGTDHLAYSVTGLPNGLGIDPSTGIITGMDDDFDASDGSVYPVTVSATDDYGPDCQPDVLLAVQRRSERPSRGGRIRQSRRRYGSQSRWRRSAIGANGTTPHHRSQDGLFRH